MLRRINTLKFFAEPKIYGEIILEEKNPSINKEVLY